MAGSLRATGCGEARIWALRLLALASAACLLALLAPAPAGAVSFSAPVEFEAGAEPQSVAIGDFNGDTKPDLAVADWGSESVSILLGDGSGGFGARTEYGAGYYPWQVAIGDFNGDTKPDLAVAPISDNKLPILLGNGDGTFTGPTFYGTSPILTSVAVGYFNADANLDVAVATAYESTVSVLLGNGDGTFGTATEFPVGLEPQSVAVGDFNGDHKADLAVADGGSNSVSILLGNGDGTFGAASEIAIGEFPDSVAVGDFNGDTKLDLAVGNGNSFTGEVSILLGNGDGTFTGPVGVSAGGLINQVAVGDLNGDGKPDLAVALRSGSGVAVLLGRGDGGFGGAQSFAAGKVPTSVAIDDLNGDGRPDLAVADGLGGVSILSNQAEPTLATNAAGGGLLGTPVHDAATLSGGESPTGTIAFRAYGPGDPTCSAAPAFTVTVAVSGNGSYASADFTPTAAGEYRWVASYSGDRLNASVAGGCGESGETSHIEAPAPIVAPVCTQPAPTPTDFTPAKRVKGHQVLGVRARISVATAAQLEIAVKLHYERHGRAHTVDLGTHSLGNPGARNLRLALPAKLRKVLSLGTRVRLTLTINAATGCGASERSTATVRTRVVKVLVPASS
jgi:hypothetical protein